MRDILHGYLVGNGENLSLCEIFANMLKERRPQDVRTIDPVIRSGVRFDAGIELYGFGLDWKNSKENLAGN